MLPTQKTFAIALGFAAVLSAGVASAQSASGEDLFKQQCAACHAIQKDAPQGMGPTYSAWSAGPLVPLQAFPTPKSSRLR